jgi:DNA-binding response OmpR family regulator
MGVTVMNEAGVQDRKRIAVIDDDPSMLTLVTATLGSIHEVTPFGDPRAALAAFRAGFVPDMIVSDVMMPHMTGFDLHMQVRELPLLVPVPFLFLSAMSDRSHHRRGMEQGADDYITKPFSLDELRNAVAVRFERAGSLRDGPSSGLVVTSLGGAGMTLDGTRVQWQAGKVVVLLLYLLHRGKSVPLREVRGELWSEAVQENSVRVLINRVRTTLAGVGEIGVQNEILQLELEQPVRWDARLFEMAAVAALEQGGYARIAAAAELYTGEFLPGMDAPWLDRQRGYYENLYCDLLEAGIAEAVSESERAAARTQLEAYYSS